MGTKLCNDRIDHLIILIQFFKHLISESVYFNKLSRMLSLDSINAFSTHLVCKALLITCLLTVFKLEATFFLSLSRSFTKPSTSEINSHWSYKWNSFTNDT
uniref:Uncharacterized protein n=1 Tax=Rhizophagus sp. DAOM 213198 TaxID=1417302 RepID=A0A0A7ANL0_9GLOM|nr:hypothetical protein [Rhizophagus sp. DAOM 213198]